MTDAIRATDITVSFGGLVAVNAVTFTVPERSVVSLIGPNGAGKTTFFNVLTGLYKPDSGVVEFQDRDVTGLPPHRIAEAGLARTFQNIRLFGLMTAEENVMVAMHSQLKAGVIATLLRTRVQKREEAQARDRARELLDFVGISHTRDEYARNLSYGDQRRLEVARALALQPKVLLLDEPTAGMNPQESARFVEFIYRLREERDTAVLLIEHDMSVVMRVSERITVLDRGEKIAEGTAEQVRSDTRVIEAYLGTGAAGSAGH
ncbi:MAG: ABC transporter ATP-binding protein [Actinobacteria bacterium]|nr:ABC transporter ATP-binding protein [Actinomycetota bacterium]